MKVEVIREEPVRPPIKEVRIVLTIDEARGAQGGAGCAVRSGAWHEWILLPVGVYDAIIEALK